MDLSLLTEASLVDRFSLAKDMPPLFSKCIVKSYYPGPVGLLAAFSFTKRYVDESKH